MRLVPLHELPLPAGIEAYRLDLNLDAEEDGVGDALVPDEHARARRFVRRADRARFMQTRAAVRRLLAHRLGVHPAGVRFDAGPQGKPCVAGDAGDARTNNPPLFNVSHAGGHALIALADPSRVTHVGIDIEARTEGFDIEPVLCMAFTARECREVRASGDTHDAFYRRWVGKEAVLKAVGVGMAEHLQCIGIHPDAKGGIDIECAVPAWRGFRAMALPMPAGHAAALAWQTKESK